MIRVFIAGPTPMIRAGLRTLLAGADIVVAGEAPGVADAALDAVDVVVVANDELLAEAARAFSEGAPPALVALSSAPERAVALLRGLPLPGWAVSVPEAPGPALQAAVLAAANGLTALPHALGARLLGGRAPVDVLNLSAGEEPLTAREREVLESLSQGLSNKQIARRLQISEHTVKFHVSSIYAKLGAGSRTEAVSLAGRRGLITL
jgi:DNA-binding NarL/FixJ family response regulator